MLSQSLCLFDGVVMRKGSQSPRPCLAISQVSTTSIGVLLAAVLMTCCRSTEAYTDIDILQFALNLVGLNHSETLAVKLRQSYFV